MSNTCLRAVLEHYRGPAARKLVLVVIADAANTHDHECWPSYRRLAGRSVSPGVMR